MTQASVPNLIALTSKVEELIYRDDVLQNVIADFLKGHELVHHFILANKDHYMNAEEHTEAICLSSYVMICLLTRINELNEIGGNLQ